MNYLQDNAITRIVEDFKTDLPDIIGDNVNLWGRELCEMKTKKEELQRELEILEQEYRILIDYGFPKFYEEVKETK